VTGEIELARDIAADDAQLSRHILKNF